MKPTVIAGCPDHCVVTRRELFIQAIRFAWQAIHIWPGKSRYGFRDRVMAMETLDSACLCLKSACYQDFIKVNRGNVAMTIPFAKKYVDNGYDITRDEFVFGIARLVVNVSLRSRVVHGVSGSILGGRILWAWDMGRV